MLRNIATKKAGFLFGAGLSCLAVPACLPDLSSLTDGKLRGGAGMGGAGGSVAGASGTAGNAGDAAESGRSMGGGGSDAGASGESGAGGDAGGGDAGAGVAGAASTKGGAGAGGTGGTTSGGGSAPLGGDAGSGGDVSCDGPGKALLCSAASWVGVPRSVEDDFTIEAWIKTSTSRAGQWFWHGTPLVWADVATTGSMDFALMILNGRLLANIGEPDSSTFGATDVATGRWVHVAMTRSRTTGAVQLFVNAQLDGTGWGNLAPLDSVLTVSLGSTPVRDLYLEGLMDEVRFWNVVRSQTELRDSMHKVLQRNEPGLVAYYQFDVVSGNRALDSSGAGNEGIVAGPNASASSGAPVCDSAGEGGAAGAAAQ